MFGMLPSRAKPTMSTRKEPPIQKFGLRFRRRQTSWVRDRDRLRRRRALLSSGSSAAGSRSSGASEGGEEVIDMGHTLTLGSSAAYSTSDNVDAKRMITAENSTLPVTALMSEVCTAWMPYWPMPDQENTISRKAEPATSVPKL